MAGATIVGDETPAGQPTAPRRFTKDLVEPKFVAPGLRTDFVRRAELISRLELARARPLILLSAPAGYGKTTLLTQWVHDSGRACVWVTLDELDAVPEVLTDTIADALASHRIQPGHGESFVLVLDDAHIVAAEALEQAVVGALERLPEGSQLAVASRYEPSLALGRMRTRRDLLELHAGDLAMSAVESASLLRKTGIELDFTAIQTLVRRTEGWPAAIALAGISCAGGAEPAERLAGLSGDHHLLADYFRTELLAQHSPETVRFLTRSSVLEHLSGPLCDAVLQRKGSAALLAKLARANLPLQPVDASHEWYRLQGMFREMLRTELRRGEPELQAALHQRASEWHLGTGDIDSAIGHARSAENLVRTGELLWANLPGYLGEGRNQEVQRWLGGITGERAAGCVPLALAGAHSNLAAGRVAVAEQWARSAAVTLASVPAKALTQERACVLLIAAWAARSGPCAMGEDAARAYDLLPEDSPWRASCSFLSGTAALLIGHEAQAELRLAEGAARGVALAPDIAALCLAQLAVLATQRGESDLASDFARRAGSMVQQHRLSTNGTSGLVFAVCAAAAMRDGRVDEAKSALSHCLGLLGDLEDCVSWYGAEARIVLARVSLALGAVADAREMLADASRLARRTAGAILFHQWFDEAWDQFDARAETALAGIATLTTAELRVLRFLPTHFSFYEIAQRLHVSSNTVKTHVHAVYRKLDSSSRSEAVARATQAGLLGG